MPNLWGERKIANKEVKLSFIWFIIMCWKCNTLQRLNEMNETIDEKYIPMSNEV